MKVKLFCVVSVLMLALLPPVARAQGPYTGLSVTGPTALTVPQGSTVYYVGTLNNTSSDTISLDGISFSFNNTANFTGVDAPFYNQDPVSLATKQTYTGTIFGVQVPASTPTGTYTNNTVDIANTNTRTGISYQNPLGYTDANSNFIAQPFTVTVTASSNPPPAPEPSGAAAMAVGVLGLAGYVLRRRQRTR